MLQRLFRRLPNAIVVVRRKRLVLDEWLGRWRFIVPLLVFAYGLLSGISINRDYAHSMTLVSGMAGLAVAATALRIWSLRGSMVTERKIAAHAAARQATQFFVQYIAMFSIPLLFLASAWLTLGCAVAVVSVTFVDPLWRRVAGNPFAAVIVRTFSAVIVVSFTYVVFFPTYLDSFYPVLALVACATALPWELIVDRILPNARSFLPFALVGCFVIVQTWSDVWLRIPPLALWLRRPALGLGIENHKLEEVWPNKVSREAFIEAANAGKTLCCLTPIVSPRGVRTHATHHWLADGKLVDSIDLSEVHGTDDKGDSAFRTFSCKQNWPLQTKKIACRTYLGEKLFIGQVVLHIEDP